MKTKVMQDPLIENLLEQMKKHFDGNENMIASYLATNMITAKELGEFILEHHELNEIPRQIQYMLAHAWNGYASVYLQDKIIKGLIDLPHQDYFESGNLDDRFAMMVKQLYQICKDEKLL